MISHGEVLAGNGKGKKRLQRDGVNYGSTHIYGSSVKQRRQNTWISPNHIIYRI